MSCSARVLPGVYFPQDGLSCPQSGPALVGAAAGLAGTPERQGACAPRWRKDARYISAPACLASARVTSSGTIVASPWSPAGAVGSQSRRPFAGPWHTMVPGGSRG